MYKEIIESIKPEMEKALAFLDAEFSKIRTGRANPSLVEDMSVDCFNEKFPLKQLGAISLFDSKTLVIQPWDKSYIEGIVSSLSKSGLGLSVVLDKDIIRVSLPSLSNEYREELKRLISLKHEEIRKSIRKWREEAWGKIQEKTRLGEIREDDKFRAKDELQKIVDDYNKKAEERKERKIKEINE
ncbi:MAG: ribosome-recycling factor [Candidatus Pacebacteria bacterium]|nr:ribosome-recycling factor [Candidatus Paceibacterota bacterium]MDD3072113.1 ribosome-recycling factor [Candidatus Paceibacterota bacterium]MDD3728822.1 ribosome-recycling factor [Candidatus Paceibacterota bacterium]MDD4201319.1 ribosome-recycling factor [Candidatus Paceibacterota bacterium]MDD4466991.1 ribosome-recycling factor [Candidatus Paceibacterota bacterium]